MLEESGSCNDTTQIMLNFLYLADRMDTVYIESSETELDGFSNSTAELEDSAGTGDVLHVRLGQQDVVACLENLLQALSQTGGAARGQSGDVSLTCRHLQIILYCRFLQIILYCRHLHRGDHFVLGFNKPSVANL